MLCRFATASITVFASLCGLGRAQFTTETALQKTGASLAADDRFGGIVALSDRYAAVGARFDEDSTNNRANVGSVTVFRKDSTGWVFDERIQPAGLVANDNFGLDLALEGNTLVVGAWAADRDRAVNTGEVRVFERGATGWTPVQTLVPTINQRGFFGRGLAISGDTIAIGAPLAANGAGQIYLYKKVNGVYSLRHALGQTSGGQILNPRASSSFGDTIALDDDVLIAGAPRYDRSSRSNDRDTGAYFLYTRSIDAAGTETWRLNSASTLSNGQDSLLGFDVAVSGDFAAVTRPGVNRSTGAVILLQRPAMGGAWTIVTAPLLAPSAARFDFFGRSIAMTDDRIIVGAHNADPSGISNAGSAYTYVREPSTNTWRFENQFNVSTPAVSNFFGEAVALTDNDLLIGADGADTGGVENSGAAYLLTNPASLSPEPIKIKTIARDGRVMVLTWSGNAGTSYRITRSSNRQLDGMWIPDVNTPNPITATGMDQTFRIGSAFDNEALRGFYRIEEVTTPPAG